MRRLSQIYQTLFNNNNVYDITPYFGRTVYVTLTLTKQLLYVSVAECQLYTIQFFTCIPYFFFSTTTFISGQAPKRKGTVPPMPGETCSMELPST